MTLPDDGRCPRCERRWDSFALLTVIWSKPDGIPYCGECWLKRQMEMQGLEEIAPDKWRPKR